MRTPLSVRLLGGVALAALACFVSTAAGEEQPPQVKQARTLAAAFPVPAKSLGFHFMGSGKRADGAEVDLSVRVEAGNDAGQPVWKVTEIWGAKTGTSGARRSVECVLAQDLTPLRGGTFEDGTAASQKVEWLGGDKVLSLQVTGPGAGGKPARALRAAWYAGQPVVEVGGFVLWARLLPRTAPPIQIDFAAPSWNRLAGVPQAFEGLGVVGGKGPDFMIHEQNAPEPTRVETWAWLGTRADGTKLLQVLIDAATGWPRMVAVQGTTYAGDSRGL